jgi:hypothetical protein
MCHRLPFILQIKNLKEFVMRYTGKKTFIVNDDGTVTEVK